METFPTEEDRKSVNDLNDEYIELAQDDLEDIDPCGCGRCQLCNGITNN